MAYFFICDEAEDRDKIGFDCLSNYEIYRQVKDMVAIIQ